MPPLRVKGPLPFVLAGTGASFPGPVKDPGGRAHIEVTNEDIYASMLGEGWRSKVLAKGWDPDHPEKVVGLKKRRWAHWIGTPTNHAEVTSADLACDAAKQAMDSARLRPADVDLLVLATTSPIRITSSTATHVAGRLDIHAPAIELKAGCSSGLYALITGISYLRMGAQTVLVVAAETLSKYATPGSQEAMFNVGDGAGALVLRAAADGPSGLLAAYLDSDGKLGEIVSTPGLLPPTPEAIAAGQYFYAGDAKLLKDAVAQRYPLVFDALFRDAGVSPSQLDLYIPHQVNKQLTDATTGALKLRPEQVLVNLHEHGNLGSACFSVALHEARTAGRVKSGSLVAAAVVGGGLTWGGVVLRF